MQREYWNTNAETHVLAESLGVYVLPGPEIRSRATWEMFQFLRPSSLLFPTSSLAGGLSEAHPWICCTWSSMISYGITMPAGPMRRPGKSAQCYIIPCGILSRFFLLGLQGMVLFFP